MSACEKCWGDAYWRHVNNPSKSQSDHYHDLLDERKDNPCPEPEEQTAEECSQCGGDICPHGVCSDNWCGQDDQCMDCWKREERKREAEEEFKWQRDVIGPMFGFKEE